jgi:hypothetical protein
MVFSIHLAYIRKILEEFLLRRSENEKTPNEKSPETIMEQHQLYGNARE